jgi:hypothetical protein
VSGAAVFAGDVGIGTTAPGARLHIEKSTNPELRITNTGASQKILRAVVNTTDSVIDIDSTFASGGSWPLTFSVGGNEYVRILSSGFVGVGVTNPSVLFHCASNAIIDGTLAVTGAATFGNTISVTGAATLESLTVASNAAITGTLEVSGAVTVNSITVTGAAVVQGSLSTPSLDLVDLTVTGSAVMTALPCMVWRLVNSVYNDADPLGSGGSDWEISDDILMEDFLGPSTAVTENSGIFTFGSTGYWKVDLTAVFGNDAAADLNINAQIQGTTDAAAYQALAVSNTSISASGAEDSVNTFCLLKISDTSNEKVKALTSVGSATTYAVGDGSINFTSLCFQKLSDL